MDPAAGEAYKIVKNERDQYSLMQTEQASSIKYLLL